MSRAHKSCMASSGRLSPCANGELSKVNVIPPTARHFRGSPVRSMTRQNRYLTTIASDTLINLGYFFMSPQLTTSSLLVFVATASPPCPPPPSPCTPLLCLRTSPSADADGSDMLPTPVLLTKKVLKTPKSPANPNGEQTDCCAIGGTLHSTVEGSGASSVLLSSPQTTPCRSSKAEQ